MTADSNTVLTSPKQFPLNKEQKTSQIHITFIAKKCILITNKVAMYFSSAGPRNRFQGCDDTNKL